jgi:CRP-like cAMP-binding protein
MVQEPGVWFSDLSPGQTRHEYQIGEQVFSEGAPADAAFYVQSGKVQLTAKSEDGELTVITVIPERSFLGESCLTDQSNRSTTANAMECSTIVRIEKQAMVELFHRDPEFAYRLLISTVSRGLGMEEKLASQLLDSGDAPLAPARLIEN